MGVVVSTPYLEQVEAEMAYSDVFFGFSVGKYCLTIEFVPFTKHLVTWREVRGGNRDGLQV